MIILAIKLLLFLGLRGKWKEKIGVVLVLCGFNSWIGMKSNIWEIPTFYGISYSLFWYLLLFFVLIQRSIDHFKAKNLLVFKQLVESKDLQKKFTYDIPAKDSDDLNRKQAAVEIVNLITKSSSSQSSFNIAIEGGWGSG